MKNKIDLIKLESLQQEFNEVIESANKLALAIINKIELKEPDYNIPSHVDGKAFKCFEIEQLEDNIKNLNEYAVYKDCLFKFLPKAGVPDNDEIHNLIANRAFTWHPLFYLDANNKVCYSAALLIAVLSSAGGEYLFRYTGDQVALKNTPIVDRGVDCLECVDYKDDLRISRPELTKLLNKIDLLRLYASNNTNDRKKKMLIIANELHNKVIVWSFNNQLQDNTSQANAEKARLAIQGLVNESMKIADNDRSVIDIVGHIILACTGVGLVIMAAKLAYTGSVFFTKTDSQKITSQISNEVEIQMPSIYSMSSAG